MPTQEVKLSALSAVLFLIISSPQLYKLTDKIFGFFGLDLADLNGCPTATGLLVHTIVYGLITYALMIRGV